MKGSPIESRRFHEWFSRNRSQLTRSGRWLDGGEPGRPDPAGFQTASVRILICRLSTYEDVTFSITHRMLYWAAGQVTGVYPDLAFLPPQQDAAILSAEHVPWWLASGCKMPPMAFDIVAISISVQQEAFNLPAALKFSGLKLSHAERMADPLHPLVIIGGNAAASVPFIHGNVRSDKEDGGLVDAVCIGDGVTWIQDFLSAQLKAKKQRGMRRKDFLVQLAKTLPGTYIPSLYKHGTEGGRLQIAAEQGAPLPARQRLDNPSDWTRGYDGAFIPFADEDAEETLPLTFGCPYRCRFCQTGWIRGSHDVISSSELQSCAARLKRSMAASDLNLLSSDACSVAGVEKTIADLLGIFPHVSVKSLSVSSLSKRSDVVKLLKLMEKREFTFGVEGVSARLRAYFDKHADTATLTQLLKELAFSGLRQLKLFFILSGMEDDKDLSEFDLLIRRVRDAVPRCRLILSFTPLFTAPFTPLQFDSLRPINESTVKDVERIAKQAGAEFRLSTSLVEIRLINLFCRAGRPATPALVRLSLERGCRYYGSIPDRDCREGEIMLRTAMQDVPLPEGAVKSDDVLPWDDIEAGTEKGRLWASFVKSAADMKNNAKTSVAHSEDVVTGRKTTVEVARMRATNRSFWAWLAPEDSWHPDCTIARGLLRDLFRKWDEGVGLYLGRPRLSRIDGASGLALLSADFSASEGAPVIISRSTVKNKERRIIEGPLDETSFDPSAFLYWVKISGDAGRLSAASFAAVLKSAKIKFQSVRKGGDIWNLVGPTFRKRHGLTAVGEGADGSTVLVCSANVDDLTAPNRNLIRGGVILAVCIESQRKCPACGAKMLQTVKAMPGTDVPECIDCFVRGDGKTRQDGRTPMPGGLVD
jgi:radical SAM superfamily enzyme YgiQ (UPF0313 family)